MESLRSEVAPGAANEKDRPLVSPFAKRPPSEGSPFTSNLELAIRASRACCPARTAGPPLPPGIALEGPALAARPRADQGQGHRGRVFRLWGLQARRGPPR